MCNQCREREEEMARYLWRDYQEQDKNPAFSMRREEYDRDCDYLNRYPEATPYDLED